MKLELFSLCEGAFNGSGRLTLVNTIDILKSDKFPCAMNLGIAMKFSFLPEEMGEHHIIMSILHQDTASVVGKLESDVNLPNASEIGYLNMAANVQNMGFPSAGWYCIYFEVDGNKIGESRILLKEE